MTAAGGAGRQFPKLLVAEAGGELLHLPRAALASLLRPGDLVVANDAATLPASLMGVHCASGEEIEVRLAAWVDFRDPMRFVAVAFGAGDYRMRTEERPPPPKLSAGDRLTLGPLAASVEGALGHPRLIRLRFAGDRASVLRGMHVSTNFHILASISLSNPTHFSSFPNHIVLFRDPTRFVAVAFGAGDYRMRTEERPPPPKLSAGDRLTLGPLAASVEGALGHPRLIRLRFAASCGVLRLVSHGRPIQYAHQPEPLALGDVWTKIAADPIAFEPPSAGFALDWRILARWRERGVAFATLSHAAGLSSTGDAMLDRRFPLDEFFRISGACASAVQAAKSRSGRVIAVGTSVVRALESAANADGTCARARARPSGRIGRGTKLRVADAILTGVHQPGESHYELLRAFADDRVLDRVRAAANERGYRAHEFGDSLLIEREGGSVL